MDTALDNALKRKKELERELREIEQFLSLHRRFAKGESGRVKSAKPNFFAGGGEAIPTVISGTLTFRDEKLRPAVLADLVEKTLREAGKPMTRGELAAKLEEEGHKIPSPDKARYLGTILWRHRNRFENIEGSGYWIRGEKFPTTFDEMLKLRKAYLD